MPWLHHSRVPDDAPLTLPSPGPASQSAGSAYVNHNLQSSCARLLSSEPWLLERTKSTRSFRSRHGYLIRLGAKGPWLDRVVFGFGVELGEARGACTGASPGLCTLGGRRPPG